MRYPGKVFSIILAILFTSFQNRGEPAASRTAVEIRGEQFLINGKPTYEGRTWRGHRIEGLLLNSRFQDEGFDEGYQSIPANWGISSERKPAFFRLPAEITGSKP